MPITLYDKDTLEPVKIYCISEDLNGYPKALIRKEEQWLWRSMEYFIEKEDRELYESRKYRSKLGMSLELFKKDLKDNKIYYEEKIKNNSVLVFVPSKLRVFIFSDGKLHKTERFNIVK